MDSSLKINRGLRLTYAITIGLVLSFILDVIFSLLYKNYSLFQPYTSYLSAIFLTYLVLESLLLINNSLESKYSWGQYPYKRFIIQLSINSLIILFIVEGIRWTYKLILGDVYFISLLDELIIIGFLLFVVLIFTMIVLSVFLLKTWRNSLAELERFKKENAEVRFESLRSQLNPHFLFNSLNTLSALVYEDTEKAALFIRELSDVYRYILENRENDLVDLTKELHFAQSYIQLIQLRFGDNIKVETAVSNSQAHFRIAPLTLQLLIENAVKHNVISKKRPLQIYIYLEENILVVKNKLQPKDTKEYSNEMGLKNIENRYAFLTDRAVEVIEDRQEFIVKIPLI
ncbi:MAG: hypothetical protein GQ527_02800 [Bacteroidales bacterium]|nr:hypothetical protein [Bacteroidales bacterium]